MRNLSLLIAGVFAAASVQAASAQSAKPAIGQASGTFSIAGKITKISHASAFIDQKDERKPVILALTDKELPTDGWKSEFDYMRYRSDHPFVGVVFWLDKNREVFRTEYNDGTKFPTSASGIFELKLDAASAKTFSGSAVSTKSGESLRSDPVKLDVRFNAALK